MILRPYYSFDLGCAAYLFGCGTLGRCAVVDARVDDVEAYTTFAATKGMRITHVIDTHVHADHRSGGPELARQTEAQVPVCTNRPMSRSRSHRSRTATRSSSETPASRSSTRLDTLPRVCASW